VRDAVSIRARLALLTAALTLVILSVFAVAIGQLTADRVRSDFQNELAAAVDRLADRLRVVEADQDVGVQRVGGLNLETFAAAGNAVVRVTTPTARVVAETPGAPNFGIDLPRTDQRLGYRIETRRRPVRLAGSQLDFPMVIQYARPVSDLEGTVEGIRAALFGGVLLGTLLAFAGGLLLARRALRPVTDLTAAAREIGETRDPQRRLPRPPVADEVGELAETLQGMLDALAASRGETEAALARQRQFVADASHELRTPLTAVLANLELLADVLDGDTGDAARSALRSSQRMRRLVGDLPLLARADADRAAARSPTDLAQVVAEAAAELAPVAGDHEVIVDAGLPAVVEGARDELHRLALNLMENAVRHTPPGTHVRAGVTTVNGHVRLTVEDDGPGVPAALRGRLFERFVRGAESHGGSVRLEEARPGARFVVTLPRAERR
jgi:two-component system, OmpR family, sensor kinase